MVVDKEGHAVQMPLEEGRAVQLSAVSRAPPVPSSCRVASAAEDHPACHLTCIQ